MKFLKRKRVLVPALMIAMLIAAYARRLSKEKTRITGYLQDAEMTETSGMAASGVFSGFYYIHNDSGDTSRFFAITPEGKLKTTCYFKGDPTLSKGVWDCEDIAAGPGPDAGKSYIYLGDIGDNKAVRSTLTLYRFMEPDLTDTATKRNVAATALHLRYPDGPRDAETLMIDPVDKLIYIVSKRQSSVSVYTTPLNFRANNTVTLTKRSVLHFGGLPPFKWITAGDISKDGSQVLLKSYKNVYYWRRTPGMPVWELLTGKPAKLFYKQEKQGEAIAFTPDGKGYYTASEGRGEPIYYYQLP